MAIHDLTVTPSPAIKVTDGVTLASVSQGVPEDSTGSLSGAVGSLDFQYKPWRRYNVTGDLTGSFTFPPINVPEITVDGLRWTFGIEFVQDATGNRAMNLTTLFANATAREGISAPNLEPGGVTVVLLTARRQSGTTTYTASLSPSIDGAQVSRGIIPVARIQDATALQKGVVQLGTGSGAAAAGDHTHPRPDSRFFTFLGSGGAALTNGDYIVNADVNFGGTVVRLTKLRLHGGTNATATAIAKIGTTSVTGTSTSVTQTADSADATATANNTFTSRQGLFVTLSDITGNPTMMTGCMHLSITGSPPAS